MKAYARAMTHVPGFPPAEEGQRSIQKIYEASKT